MALPSLCLVSHKNECNPSKAENGFYKTPYKMALPFSITLWIIFPLRVAPLMQSQSCWHQQHFCDSLQMQPSEAGSECGREEGGNLKGERIPTLFLMRLGRQWCSKYPSVSLEPEKCFQILLIALIGEVFKESTDLLENWVNRSKKDREGNLW